MAFIEALVAEAGVKIVDRAYQSLRERRARTSARLGDRWPCKLGLGTTNAMRGAYCMTPFNRLLNC
jgi:hypothetical protein